jgi:hypothetical protein
MVDNNFYCRVINCEMEQPPQEHEWTVEVDFGHWPSYGDGTMKYRKCLKCGYIEYSLFTDVSGVETDIDSLYRASFNAPLIFVGCDTE